MSGASTGVTTLSADGIRFLFDYSYSATGRVLDAARQLSTAQFTTPPPLEGGRSLQHILVHMLDAERGWREGLRTRGTDDSPDLNPADFPDVATLVAAWEADEVRMRDWLAALDDEDMNIVAFDGLTLWQLLTHVVNHSTQHRSEAAMVLTHWGQSPGDLDLLFYLEGWPED